MPRHLPLSIAVALATSLVATSASAQRFLADDPVRRDPMTVLVPARTVMLFFGALLSLAVWGWARQMWGVGPGLVAMGLTALSPVVLAHARLVLFLHFRKLFRRFLLLSGPNRRGEEALINAQAGLVVGNETVAVANATADTALTALVAALGAVGVNPAS